MTYPKTLFKADEKGDYTFWGNKHFACIVHDKDEEAEKLAEGWRLRPLGEPAPAPEPDPLDHDGDGKNGGSLPKAKPAAKKKVQKKRAK